MAMQTYSTVPGRNAGLIGGEMGAKSKVKKAKKVAPVVKKKKGCKK